MRVTTRVTSTGVLPVAVSTHRKVPLVQMAVVPPVAAEVPPVDVEAPPVAVVVEEPPVV